MTIVVLHQVRHKKGLPPEPVGLWAIQGEESRPFYPAEHGKYLPRAEKALMVRPDVGLEQWAYYKAHTSSNWRILDLDLQFDYWKSIVQDVPVEDIHRLVRDEYLSKVATLQREHEHDRSHPAIGSVESALEEYGSTPGGGPTRFAIAQSWWIASELVHRHPELMVQEMHPAGGTYDVLCVTSAKQLSPERSGQSVAPQVMLNRVGTVQMHFRGDMLKVGDWTHVMGARTPHSIVKKLEGLTGWGPTGKPPPATPRSIAYRFLATALTVLLNDRHVWDVRNEFIDSSGQVVGEHARFVDAFPGVVEDLRVTPILGIWGEPHSHYWALLRGKHPVVIVSIEGKLYYESGKSVDLMSVYEKHDRRIIPMTVAMLKKWI